MTHRSDWRTISALALYCCYCRQGVARKLAHMSDWLRDSYLTLVIWDAWRPVTVQKVVYDAYKEQLRHEHPHASEDELVMAQAGFMNYPEEWRHYDLGNRRWAAQTGRPAIYGPVEQV